MGSLDTISIGILLGGLLVLAGIMSSLVAMRFGAPLLLVFLVVGMLARLLGWIGAVWRRSIHRSDPTMATVNNPELTVTTNHPLDLASALVVHSGWGS